VLCVAGAGRVVETWDLLTGRRRGLPLTGHSDTVDGIATAQLDGRPLAVTAARDATIRVWDLLAADLPPAPFTGHTKTVLAAAAVEVDGSPVVVTGGEDGTVRTWDLATGQPFSATVDLGERITTGFRTVDAPDGPVVAVGDAHGKVHVIDVRRGAVVGDVMPVGDDVYGADVAMVGGRLVAVGADWEGRVQGWVVSGRTPLGPGCHLGAGDGGDTVRGAVFADDHSLRAVVATVTGVYVVDLASGRYEQGPRCDGNWYVQGLSRLDGRPVTIEARLNDNDGGGAVRLVDALSGRPLGSELTAASPLTGVWAHLTEFEGRPVLVASTSGRGLGALAAWDAASGTPLPVPPAPKVDPRAVACASAGAATVVVVGHADGSLTRWDLADGTPRMLVPATGARAVATTSPRAGRPDLDKPPRRGRAALGRR
jgi:WD40 repeat protein